MKHLPIVLAAVLCLPRLAISSKNLADYPVEVHVLQVQWQRDRYGVVHGTGVGNVREGDSIRGFDFSYDGCPSFRVTPANLSYPGKWKKSELRLEVLIAEAGAVGRFMDCELKTTVRTHVYMRGPGGITAVDQEQFKARRAGRQTARANQQRPGSPSPAAIQKAKLAITSEPDAADIEVDGEFVGNTPSVLELDPGEHEISVRKDGYIAWQRKLKLVSGDIKITAQLERSSK